MIYAIIAIIAVLLIFVLVSYFIMKKTIKFVLNGKNVVLKSQGNSIKIYSDNNLINTTLYPNLLGGQDIEVKIDEKEYLFKCKSSSFGSKMRVEVYSDGQFIADNGVQLKQKTK